MLNALSKGLRAVLARACFAAMLAAPAAAGAAPMLWFADDAKLHQADAGSATLLRSLPLAVQGLSADALGGAWVVTATQVVHVDRGGVAGAAVAFAAIGLAAPVQVAADPRDGSAWVLAQRKLVHLSAGGSVLGKVDLPMQESTVALRVTPDQRVWALSRKSLLLLSPAGAVLAQASVGGALGGPATRLAVDAGKPMAWVAHDNLNQNGQVVSRNLVRADFGGAQPSVSSIYSSSVNDVDVDAAGEPWALPDGALQRYDGAGVLRQSIDLKPLGLGSARRLAVDAIGGRLWLGHERGVSALSAAGASLGEINTGTAIRHLSASPPTTDTAPPRFVELAPANDSRVTQPDITVSGRIDEAGTVRLGAASAQGPAFSFPVTLNPGTNTLLLSATDIAGNSAQLRLSYHYLTLAVTAPVSGATVQAASIEVGGTFSGPADTQISVNGVAAALSGSSFTATVPLAIGANQLNVTLTSGGVTVSKAVSITRSAPASGVLLPSPIDKTVPSILFDTTAFLYSGDNPVQTGVAAGTIEARRAAVARGKILARDGQPLAGVRVTIHKNAQYGQTLSRSDGMYDMAVNGGGVLTVNYEKLGYLPVQRQVKPRWQDFAVLEDVVMIPLDDAVTTIDLSAAVPMQVARGSVVTDADGTRRATVMFPQGTTAQLVMANGGTQPLNALSVRATEYTVGPNGSKTMPGPLPPTSAYTYAMELSVDEAISAGAKEVRFNQPVPVYVDNFLKFPVGGIVPVGYYDRERAAWIASRNGRVIKVLSVITGAAEMDITGDDIADDAASLAAIGITEAERARVAELFSAGQSLWRMQVTHFTPWDCNWPYGPPQDAERPQQPDPDKPDEPCDDPDCQSGSIIEAQNRTLGEAIPIAGSPLALSYRSDRVPGRKNALMVRLTGPTVSASLARVYLVATVAGRTITRSYPPLPNQSDEFEWDGRDAYDRTLVGEHKVDIKIGYAYPVSYLEPNRFNDAFAAFGGAETSRNASRSEVVIWQTMPAATVRSPGRHSVNSNMGGWTFSNHHSYDPISRVLHLGGGSHRRADNMAAVITTAVGPGTKRADGSAFDTWFRPSSVAVDSDGSVYFAEDAVVYRMASGGTITTFAGNGIAGDAGDGRPAAEASLSYFEGDMVFGPDGSLYIPDSGNHRIRRVTPDGVITTVAGNGTEGFSGDGGPATQASLNLPMGTAVAGDGTLYIADSYNHRIRRVTPDGLITTIAGFGPSGYANRAYAGDGGPASSARFGVPHSLDIGSDGSLYVADYYNNRVRRIAPNGIITTVAGNGGEVYSGNGGRAVDAGISNPLSVKLGDDGDLFVLTPRHIHRVTSEGTILIVAGTAQSAPPREGVPAAAEYLRWPQSISLGKDGSIYFADYFNARVRVVASTLPGLGVAVGEIAIASEDGREVYHFSGNGRHLRTLNARTGKAIDSFSYSDGQLSEIADGDGQVTRVERGAGGSASAIVAPQGQRTELTYDSNGWLSSVSDPLGQAHRAEYTADGLLTRFVMPRGNASAMTYDSFGRLLRDEDASGGFWELASQDNGAEVVTTMTSAEGRVRGYSVEAVKAGGERRVNTAPDGSKTIRVKGLDEITTTTHADGMTVTSELGPDPRFGMQAPFERGRITRMPSGLTATTTTVTTATLSDAADLSSMTQEQMTVTVNGRISRATYDVASRQWSLTSAQGRTSILRTDDSGKPTFTQHGGLDGTSCTYDSRGRLATVTQGSGESARSLTYTYGADGYLERVADALTQTVVYQRDAVGRVTQMTMPGGHILGMTHDANGNLLQLTPPERPGHAFAYTNVDLEAQYTPPAVAGVPDVATRFAYNRDQDVTRIDMPNGNNLVLTYDSGGRLAAVTPSAGAGNAIAMGYSAASGQLSSISTTEATLSIQYDGPLPKQEALSGVLSGTLARTFDSDFRLSGLSVNGVATTFAFDSDSLLTRSGVLNIARHASHGGITGTTLGGVTTSQGYNGFGELTNFGSQHGSNQLLSYQLGYDRGGRIASKTETVVGVTTQYVYAYDAAGRLASVGRDGSMVAAYGYDANGNRLQLNGVTVATYDAQDRLLTHGSASYAYDANGTLTERTEGGATTRYTYDAFGNLKTVQLPGGLRLDYVIDGANRRIGKRVDGAMVQGFLYQDQLRIAAELNGRSEVVARFVYGEKRNVPEYMVKGGMTYRLITDHLGSVRLVVDTQGGQIAQRIDYDEWGRITSDSNPGFQPFGYAGGQHDQHTGLTRFGARDYDAQVGRWTAKDPIRFAGGDANLYAYVLNNPLTLIDPQGLAGRGPFQPSPQTALEQAIMRGDIERIRTLIEAGETIEANVLRQCVAKRGASLVKELKEAGRGAGSRSGQHGTPSKQAGSELVREGNQVGGEIGQALKDAGSRLIDKGKGINHY